MVYVLCANDAALAIKSYSPELIVFPVIGLDGQVQNEIDQETIVSVIRRSDMLVIGPGLSRHDTMMKAAAMAFSEAKSRMVPIILDGVSVPHFSKITH